MQLVQESGDPVQLEQDGLSRLLTVPVVTVAVLALQLPQLAQLVIPEFVTQDVQLDPVLP